MSITVDTINLRFNVKPDYNQQQLQQLAEDLKQSQRETSNVRKEIDKFTQNIVAMQNELSTLKQRRHELQKQPSLSKKEEKELARLNITINKTQLELDGARNHVAELSATHTEHVHKMQDLEKQMQQETKSVNLYAMSLNQLRERQRDLNAVLNNLSPKNEMYQQLKEELDGVNQRMKELRQATLQMHDDMDLSEMSVNQLNERLQALNAAFRDCDPNSDEFKQYSEAIKKTQKQLDTMNAALKEADKEELKFHNDVKLNDLTLDQLNERLHALTVAFRNCDPNSDEFDVYAKKIEDTKNQISELEGTVKKTKGSLGAFTEKMNVFSFAIVNALAIKDRIVQWADQYVQAFAKTDEAMTDVMKYTGQTKREVEEMNETFKKMTTRTAREELNALAGAAGRLGITARKDIEGFVSAADKINVALGDDLGEGAIDQIGKLTMVFGEDKKKGLEGAMLATGSAINVLGASSSANTGFITEFTSSMAGMAVNAKISQTDIMGYASALSQAGIEGQTASGVFAQMITKMFTDPAKFAKAAKLDVKSFTDLLKTDANKAILQFLEGLKSNGGFDSLAPALKSLKMQGTQAVPVISSLINKMDDLKTAQRTAAQAYNDGTSIIDEFNNANSSAAAKLEIAKKAMNDEAATLGQKLMPIVESSIKSGTVALKILSEIAGFVTRNIAILTTLAATVAIYTAAVKGATAATKIWSAVTKATPWGLALAGLTALLVAYDKYKTRMTEMRQLREELNEVESEAVTEYSNESREVRRLDAAMRDERVSLDERRKALDRLKTIIPEYNGMLDEEGRLTRDNKAAIDDYLVSLQKQIRLKAYQSKLEELYARQAEQEDAQRTASDEYWNARQTNTLQQGNGRAMSLMRWLGIGEEASLKSTLDDADKALADTNDKITTLENRIKDLGGSPYAPTTSADTPADSGSTDFSAPAGSTSGDTEESTKERNARLKKQRDERRELETEAKQAYEQEKIELRQQYQGKEKLQDEWHEKQYLAEQRYIDRLAQVRVKYGASESERMEVANMQLDSITREANRRQEVEKRKQQERLTEIDRQQDADEIALAQQRLNGEIVTQREYDERKLQMEIDYQRRRITYLKEGSAEYLQAMKQLLQLEQQQADSTSRFTREGKETYQSNMNTFLHDQFTDLSSFDKMRELNEQFYEQGRISYQQYQENLTQIAQEQEEQRSQIQQAALDASQQLLNSASSFFSAMQQRETAEVDAKYKKLIDKAKKQGKDTTKLEEQQEQEKAVIQKKYADRNFKIQVLQIIANTAQGISKTIAELGMPWAVPFVAMAAAAGAMQLAAAKASAEQAAGLYSGGYTDDYTAPAGSASGVEGYTRRGNPRRRAGFIPVHQNEFVANHRAVANPQVRPVLDVIDAHQRAGDIQLLNATRLLDEAYGRYSGGFTRNTQSPSPVDYAATPSQSTAADLLPVLTRIEQNTARSLTVRRLRDEIAHEERLEQNAHR